MSDLKIVAIPREFYYHEVDYVHSLRVALMAAEATLALCGSVNAKLPGYIEDRRAETHRIVKAALENQP